jgi:uncharacterized membrane protein
MDTLGKIATSAALAAGGLLLSRQVIMKTQPTGFAARRIPSPVMRSARAARRTIDSQVHQRPGTLGAIAALAIGGWFLSRQLRQRQGGWSSWVEQSIEVDVPVGTAYNQWTQFEEFPQFMDSVLEVKQLDDTHLRWRANVAGKTKEWDAEITEQLPDTRIAWRSTSGASNAGVVTFNKVGDSRTRVLLQMDYDPEGLGERVGDALGAMKLTARGNLKRFKDLVESRGVETGAWRGEVARH